MKHCATAVIKATLHEPTTYAPYDITHSLKYTRVFYLRDVNPGLVCLMCWLDPEHIAWILAPAGTTLFSRLSYFNDVFLLFDPTDRGLDLDEGDVRLLVHVLDFGVV